MDDVPKDIKYSSQDQGEKQKIVERSMSWQMSYGQGEDVARPTYDKEVSLNRIPLLTNGFSVL